MTPLPRPPCRLLSAALLLGGCYGPVGPRTRASADPPPAASGPSTEAPTVLLTAHAQPAAAVDREFALPVTGVVYLVFSRPIDAISLAPHRFVLALPDGQRVTPVGALLGPAQERDEHCTALLLVSDARSQKTPLEPISVTVTGLVHDRDGRVLEGLSADVSPRSRPVFAVRAEAVATTTTCAGYDHAVRVYWSAPVTRPDTAPWPQVALEATPTAPQGVDDVDEPGADNVVDYCLRGPGNPRWIDLPPGAVVDLRGGAAAKAGLAIQPHGPAGLGGVRGPAGPRAAAVPVPAPAS
ncbi:MAG: hypothetical protein JNL82_36575 [Myxococcales bacterium]|nr:hypothetical protein [Myxococcales bacterium]